MCSTDGVSTKIPFPECCWTCVAYTNCEETDGATTEGGTDGGATTDAPDTGAPTDPPTDGSAFRTMPKKGNKNRKAIDLKKKY